MLRDGRDLKKAPEGTVVLVGGMRVAEVNHAVHYFGAEFPIERLIARPEAKPSDDLFFCHRPASLSSLMNAT